MCIHVCVYVMAVFIFKIILIYCNLYKVVNISKFSMPTVIHCHCLCCSHAGVQFTGCSAMSNLARAGTWLHGRQRMCVSMCVCVGVYACLCVRTGVHT